MIRPVTHGAGFDERPVRAFRPGPGRPADPDRWPATVPAVAQMLRDGLDLAAGLTVLVGENGSGKSTVVEALAGTWEDLNLAVAWRQFMRDPRSYFRHLF